MPGFNTETIKKIGKFYEEHEGESITLKEVIKMITGHEVIPINPNNIEDQEIVSNIKKAAEIAMNNIIVKKIRSRRVNEVGNYVEPFIRDALKSVGYDAEIPETPTGKHQSAGYPDLVFQKIKGMKTTTTYVECKTYNNKTIDTTQRTFYLSPSEEFKVTTDAHHLLISIEIQEVEEERKGEERVYTALGWKVLDVADLIMGLKMEFNSSNKMMYNKYYNNVLGDGKK